MLEWYCLLIGPRLYSDTLSVYHSIRSHYVLLYGGVVVIRLVIYVFVPTRTDDRRDWFIGVPGALSRSNVNRPDYSPRSLRCRSFRYPRQLLYVRVASHGFFMCYNIT